MKSKIIVLIMLFCIMCPQFVVFGNSEYVGVSKGIDEVYTVNSSGDLIFKEVALYEHYCQNVEFMKAYIFERSNKVSRDNVVYIGYHRVSDLGKAARYLFFIPDDESIPLSDIIACPKSNTFNSGNYMEFYNKNTGLVVKGTIYSFNNTANEIAGKEQISMQYNSHRNFCTIGGSYFIDCPKELLLSNMKIYGYDNNVQLSSSQCKEILDNAINGSIEADNETAFLPKRYGVIEPPQNLKLTYTGKIINNSDVKFTWSQSDERYKSWTTEIMIHGNIGYKLTVDLFGDFNQTGTLLLKTDAVPTSNFRYKMNFVDLLEECRASYRQIVVEKYGDWVGTHVQLMECTISFRNRYSDGECVYYSNWVKVYADDEHKNHTVEYEYNDPVYGDENFDYSHDTPIGNINPDSPYQDVDIITDTSFGDWSDLISNGFGLSGENGIFDMFSDIFSFIPSPIWSLILTGVSVLIAIALFKAVF